VNIDYSTILLTR